MIREPTTPQCHQSQSRQNKQNTRDLGSPENQRTPVPPTQGAVFNGQQYDYLPENVVMGMQRVQTLEQARQELEVQCCHRAIFHRLFYTRFSLSFFALCQLLSLFSPLSLCFQCFHIVIVL